MRAAIPFLGRRLRREGESIKILASENYIDEMLEEHGLHHANPVVSPGTTQVAVDDPVSALSSADATTYRRGVGKAMWLTRIRGDMYYVTKELARNLQNPTNEDMAKLRHLMRYLKEQNTTPRYLPRGFNYMKEQLLNYMFMLTQIGLAAELHAKVHLDA